MIEEIETILGSCRDDAQEGRETTGRLVEGCMCKANKGWRTGGGAISTMEDPGSRTCQSTALKERRSNA